MWGRAGRHIRRRAVRKRWWPGVGRLRTFLQDMEGELPGVPAGHASAHPLSPAHSTTARTHVNGGIFVQPPLSTQGLHLADEFPGIVSRRHEVWIDTPGPHPPACRISMTRPREMYGAPRHVAPIKVRGWLLQDHRGLRQAVQLRTPPRMDAQGIVSRHPRRPPTSPTGRIDPRTPNPIRSRT